MKVFQYSLEPVLDYRKNKEEERKQQFAQIQQRFIEETRKLENLEDQLHKAISASNRISSKKINIQKNFHHYIQYLREKITLQSQLTSEVEEELEKSRNHFILAQKDRKTVEKLKEKAFERYKLECDQIEQKINDEFALYTFFRKS